MYRDKLTLYRYEDVLIDGFDKQHEKLICKDVPCKLSKGKTVFEDGIPKIKSEHKLFVSDVDIHEGDKLMIRMFNGKVLEFYAGEAFPYSSHIEVELKRNETV